MWITFIFVRAQIYNFSLKTTPKRITHEKLIKAGIKQIADSLLSENIVLYIIYRELIPNIIISELYLDLRTHDK